MLFLLLLYLFILFVLFSLPFILSGLNSFLSFFLLVYVFFLSQAFHVKIWKTLVKMWSRIWVYSEKDFKAQDNLKYAKLELFCVALGFGNCAWNLFLFLTNSLSTLYDPQPSRTQGIGGLNQ